MANYLALIRKQDFADLYANGIFHANRDLIIEFSCPIENIKENHNFFNSISAFANKYNSTLTYVLVHYCKTSTNTRINDIEIEEVQNIFPLDNKAKIEFENTFDKRIIFREPLWTKDLLDFEKRKAFENSIKGTVNLWKILDFSKEQYDRCKKIIPDSILRDIIDDTYSNKRPEGNLPLWEYLLRYERHSFYPNTTIGFYMDAIHAVVNKMQKKEIDNYEPTNIFHILDSMDKNLKSDTIYSILHNTESAKPILNIINEYCPDVDYLIVSTCFLVLKKKYIDSFKYDKEFINACNSIWPKEFPIAIYMLGFILGHEKTYDCLYEELPINIFRKKIIEQDNHEILNDNEQHLTIPQNNIKKDENTTEINSVIKIWMCKWNKKHTKPLKSPKPKLVTSKEMMESLKTKGWEIMENNK